MYAFADFREEDAVYMVPIPKGGLLAWRYFFFQIDFVKEHCDDIVALSFSYINMSDLL